MGIKVPAGLCRECLAPTGDLRKRTCPLHRGGHKYNATEVRDEEGKLLYRSKKEANRHRDLLYLEQMAVIQDLRREVRYKLKVNGKQVATYVADFVYREDGKKVVEDAKGVRTPYYRGKARLSEAVAGYKIREV